jgi:hypothetical protein
MPGPEKHQMDGKISVTIEEAKREGAHGNAHVSRFARDGIKPMAGK